MNPDPATYILAAALLGAAIGFFCCALVASGRIREERDEAYWDGYAACNREHEKKP